MSNQSSMANGKPADLKLSDWVKSGAVAAIISIAVVLVVRAVAIAIWPEIALFTPLDSYLRTIIFTLVPAIVATALFAWLVGHAKQPIRPFIIISVVVLVISFIPDYILPDPHKTFLASTVAAVLHVAAAIPIVAVLVMGYQRQTG